MCRKIIDPREDSLKLLSKYVYLKENMYIQKKIEKKMRHSTLIREVSL